MANAIFNLLTIYGLDIAKLRRDYMSQKQPLHSAAGRLWSHLGLDINEIADQSIDAYLRNRSPEPHTSRRPFARPHHHHRHPTARAHHQAQGSRPKPRMARFKGQIAKCKERREEDKLVRRMAALKLQDTPTPVKRHHLKGILKQSPTLLTQEYLAAGGRQAVHRVKKQVRFVKVPLVRMIQTVEKGAA